MSGLQDINYTELTELQEEVIPAVLEGNDALITAEPGSSRIASFVIPALEQINKREDKEGTSVLILTPNPEESKTIDELVWAMGYHGQIECASIDLDTELEEQKEAIQSQVEVIVGNPGPLLDVCQDLRFIFRHVGLVVIDAADEMAALNLQDKIQNILKRVLSDHQMLIYSQKLNDDVKDLAKRYCENPVAIGFEDKPGMLTDPPKVDQNLSQGYIYVPSRMKITTLMAHVEDNPSDNCVIFTASKRGTDRLYRTLRKNNLKATSIHGKLSDEKRAQRFANFTNGDVQYLLVADIPAAELELDRVTQVINYDVPNDPDEYRYRAGMVGSGKASRIVSLVSKQDRSDINELENSLGQAPKELPLPDKVKQKLKERKKKKKKKSRGKKRSNRGRNNGRSKKKKKDDGLQLPRPSYDKLSGGRKGDVPKDQKDGVIGLIKKLFS
ncbi:MAG: DEAD/DEAH box helicase [Bacteroidota bacterium]